MDGNRVNSWLQLAANLGVIAGLVFVALELAQNTAMTRAQTRGNVAQAVVHLIELERDPRIVQANLRLERGEELTEEDRYLLENMANATLRVWENTYYQYSADLFDKEEFAADLEVWEEFLRTPIYAGLWERTRHTYASNFREVIDGLVLERP